MVRFRVLCSGILGAWSRETADAGKDSGVKYLSRTGKWSVQGCLLEEGGGGSWTSGVEEVAEQGKKMLIFKGLFGEIKVFCF